MNNRCTLRVTGMDYHTKQLPLHCRVCGKRLMKSGQKKSTYECKGFADDLLTAFAINTSTDIAHMHPERFCECCHLSMRRIICARAEKVHHKCTLTPFEWEEHRNEGCKVHIYYIPARVHTCNILCNTQVCEHFRVIAKGGNSRKLTVGRGRQPGLTPNMVAARLWNIAPPPEARTTRLSLRS